MIEHWQTWLAALFCLVAAVYVLRRVWLSFGGGKKAGCGSGCSSCASAPEAKPLQQISLEKAESNPGR